MLPVSQVIIAAFILSVIVVIFAVIEWFHLLSLSSTILRLESMIEKKSQEFDQFRRERTSSVQYHTLDPQQTDPIVPTSEGINNSDQIQIIRNVHGTFKDTSLIEINGSEPTPFQQNTPAQSQYITLYLYSDVSKDADFSGLWSTLNMYLKSDTPVAVTIDFTGIDFIYENEIRYLEEIVRIVESRQGGMIFTNCSQDVIALMNSFPRLLSRIKY
jgi:hypothetical protein